MISFTAAELQCIEDIIADTINKFKPRIQNAEVMQSIWEKVWHESCAISRKALDEKEASLG